MGAINMNEINDIPLCRFLFQESHKYE